MSAPQVLLLGVQGEAVTNLQADLLALGVLDAKSALAELADASFGDQTNDALRAFQSNKKLPVTGVLDDVSEDTIRRALADSRSQTSLSRCWSGHDPQWQTSRKRRCSCLRKRASWSALTRRGGD